MNVETMTPPKQETPPPPPAPVKSTFLARIHRALGPVAGGLIIDLLDLATIGPIGIYLGMVVGCLVGWWVGSFLRFSTRARLSWSFLCGLYCTLPLTGFFPVMTIISAVARFGEEPAPEDAPAPNRSDGANR